MSYIKGGMELAPNGGRGIFVSQVHNEPHLSPLFDASASGGGTLRTNDQGVLTVKKKGNRGELLGEE